MSVGSGINHMQVHLIDGTYELFRMYFGAPSSSSSDGQEIGASRALLRSFAALLRDPAVTHVGVAFDHEIRSFRNDLFDGYKTGEGIEPDLLAQFPLAEWVARSLGMTVWPMKEFEADDGIASAAKKLEMEAEVERVLILSPDKDLAQCVGDKVVLFDRRKDLLMDDAGVVEKFGVPPASIPDYLALVGDAADGIPGVPRWGQKSTAKVLSEYLSFDLIPKNVDEWSVKVRGAASLSTSLEAHREEAALYRKLATLRTDAPVQASLETLEWQGPNEDLVTLCELLDQDMDALRLPEPRSLATTKS